MMDSPHHASETIDRGHGWEDRLRFYIMGDWGAGLIGATCIGLLHYTDWGEGSKIMSSVVTIWKEIDLLADITADITADMGVTPVLTD